MNNKLTNPSDIHSIINQFGQRVGGLQINTAGDFVINSSTMGLPPVLPSAPSPLKNFIGRKAELDTIYNILNSATKQIALYGMGGVGKTAIALEVANRFKDDFPGGIFWGNLHDYGDNPQQILYGWGRACTDSLPAELELASLAGYVRNLLSARINVSGEILIICDHISMASLETFLLLKSAIPAEAALLLTMRERELTHIQDGKIIGIEPFMEQEALELLSKHIGDRRSALESDKERETTLQLLSFIGYHPLAIEIAGKRLNLLLQKPRYTVEKFYHTLIQSPFKALVQPGIPPLDALLSSTYEVLPKRLQKVFCSIGVFISGPITVAGVAAITDMSHADTEAELDELVFAALIDWGLQEHHYTIHPLLRQYAQVQLQMTEDVEHQRRNHALFYLDFIKKNARFDPHCHDLMGDRLPDIMAAFEFLHAHKCHEQIVTMADLLYTESKFLEIRSYVYEAECLLIAAITASQALQDSYREGCHLGNLGNVYFDIGKPEQAFKCYYEAQLCANTNGNRRLEMEILISLGRGCLMTQNVESACDHFHSALAIANDLNARSSQCILLGNLGNAYQYLDQIDLAMEFYHKSQAIAQEINDERNRGVTLGNLGRLYQHKNQPDKAIEYYTQALTIAYEVGDVRNRGIWLGHLGNAYADQGQWQRAIKSYEQALTLAKKNLDVRREGIWLGNLGTVYEKQGDITQALKLYHSAWEIAQAISDLSSSQIWLNNLGTAYSQSGDHEQAIGFFEQGLKLASAQKNEQAIISQLINLGLTYKAIGQEEQANVYLADAQNQLPQSDDFEHVMLKILLRA